MALKKNPPEQIDPDAYYAVKIATRFAFEGVDFLPLAEMEIDGAMLARLVADETAKTHLAGYDKKA